MTAIEKLQSGLYDLSQYSEMQRNFILAIAKMSYIEGHRAAQSEIATLALQLDPYRDTNESDVLSLENAEIKTEKNTIIFPDGVPF